MLTPAERKEAQKEYRALLAQLPNEGLRVVATPESPMVSPGTQVTDLPKKRKAPRNYGGYGLKSSDFP